ncbi:hypothetical protein KYC5002_49005 [Archangium violaceum]|uniref:hypothetical protein n=1 Tax=Archangium violaceum TaxID=83451 RepID=UPI002B281986|nr:hypothetical protein KYC5002_49005 [Archangium gephyra]
MSQLAVYASSRAGAYVTFNSYGDHFVVQDTAADGHSALVQILNGGTASTCRNNLGAGRTVDCNYNFAEGRTILFRACVGEYGARKIIACADFKSANTAN